MRSYRLWWLWLGVSLMLGNAGHAQDPNTRPKLLWHIGATRAQAPVSFTEDGQFLLTFGRDSLIQVYRVYGLSGASLLDPSTPLGQALTTYDFAQRLRAEFTDRTHTNEEYVIAFGPGGVTVWPFVRGTHPAVFRGAYLGRPRAYNVPGWEAAYSYDDYWDRAMVLLRGERTDRRYNLVAVAGDLDGNLRIVYIDPARSAGSTLTPVVVSNAHGGSVICMVYSPRTRTLYTGGADGIIGVWRVSLSISGGNVVPSLTRLQAIPAHMEPIISLALASRGGNDYLVSLSDDNTIAGWSLNTTTGAISAPTPLWTQSVEALSIYEVYNTVDWTLNPGMRLRGAPYGDAPWVTLYLSMNRPWEALGSGSCYFIDSGTGEAVAIVRFTDLNELAPTATYITPVINGQRYLVHSGQILRFPFFLPVSTLGLTPLVFERRLTESRARPPVSALHLPPGASSFAAGFDDGSVSVYPVGGFNVLVGEGTPHLGRRVVGVRLIPGSTFYTISVDIGGRLVVARISGGSLITEQSLDLATGSNAFLSVHALDYLPSTGLIAVAGTGSDGRPLVRTFRLTLSPSVGLTADASFSIANESAPATSVRILPSQDLVVATGTRVSHWQRSGSNYSRQLDYTFRWSDPPATIDRTDSTVIAVGSEGYLWAGTPRSPYPHVRAVANNTSIYEPPRIGGDTTFFTRAYPIEAAGNEEAVWGMSLRNPAGDTGFLVAHGRTLLRDRDSVVWNTLHISWFLIVPEAVEALTADRGTVIAGLANGQIYQHYIPTVPMHRAGYDVLSARFSVRGNEVVTYLGEFPARPHTQDYNGVSRVARLSLANGQVLASALYGFRPEAGSSMTVQLSPSGNALYGYLPGSSLWGQDASTFAPLFTDTTPDDRPRHWLLAVDGQHLGLLRVDPQVTSITQGGTVYYRARFAMEFYQHTNPSQPLTLAGQYALDENAALGIWWRIFSPNYRLEFLRWDLNANRTLAVIIGVHNEWVGTNLVSSHRLLILQRQGTGWSNWVVRTLLSTRNASNANDFGTSFPTYVRFHPTLPNVLYVGFDDGRLRAYNLATNGQILGLREFVPTRGNPGSVGALDVGEVVLRGYRYVLLAFGGPNGLSIWAGSPCVPESIRETHFYDQDIAFFRGTGYIQVSQAAPESPSVIVYGNGLTLSAAQIDNIPSLPCPEDIDRNGTINNADLLAVLFRFGQSGAFPEDVNCDGIVNNADLLAVLFRFGSTCP